MYLGSVVTSRRPSEAHDGNGGLGPLDGYYAPKNVIAMSGNEHLGARVVLAGKELSQHICLRRMEKCLWLVNQHYRIGGRNQCQDDPHERANTVSLIL